MDSSLQPLLQPTIKVSRAQTGSFHQHPQSILDHDGTKPTQTKTAPRHIWRRRQNRPYITRLPKPASMERHLRTSQIRRWVLPQGSQILHPRTERTEPPQRRRGRPRKRKTPPLPRLFRKGPARPGGSDPVLCGFTRGAIERGNRRLEGNRRYDPVV